MQKYEVNSWKKVHVSVYLLHSTTSKCRGMSSPRDPCTPTKMPPSAGFYHHTLILPNGCVMHSHLPGCGVALSGNIPVSADRHLGCEEAALEITQNVKHRQGPVACNPSYLGGRDQEISVQGQPPGT
jgi:hypothetical protein